MVRAIRDNNNDDSQAAAPVEFTPESATKMLPLVKRISGDLVRLSLSIETRKARLRDIDRLPSTNDQPDYRDELSDIRGSLVRDEQALQGCLSELEALGLRAHQPIDGSIDFPALINRRPIYLCWKPTDEKVEKWHEANGVGLPRKSLGLK